MTVKYCLLDILQLRVATQRVTRTTFNPNPKTEFSRFHVFDVSGLKQDRMKWMKYFDMIQMVLYVLSLSSYDQMMSEDGSENRMRDAINLFKTIADHELLQKCTLMIFLNKKDLYEKKVKKVAIIDYFPQYTGMNTLTRKTSKSYTGCNLFQK